jgi:hypothetical protein
MAMVPSPVSDLTGRTFETRVEIGAEARLFDMAVFRYLERHATTDEDRATVFCSTPDVDGERKTVALWSEAAAEEFAVFWWRVRVGASGT